MAVQAGLAEISTDSIEAQYLAGGIERVTLALIVAHRAAIEWTGIPPPQLILPGAMFWKQCR